MIVDELFPPGVDSDVDRLVTLLAQEMIDEFPASDPRWAESVHQGTSIGSCHVSFTFTLYLISVV